MKQLNKFLSDGSSKNETRVPVIDLITIICRRPVKERIINDVIKTEPHILHDSIICGTNGGTLLLEDGNRVVVSPQHLNIENFEKNSDLGVDLNKILNTTNYLLNCSTDMSIEDERDILTIQRNVMDFLMSQHNFCRNFINKEYLAKTVISLSHNRNMVLSEQERLSQKIYSTESTIFFLYLYWSKQFLDYDTPYYALVCNEIAWLFIYSYRYEDAQYYLKIAMEIANKKQNKYLMSIIEQGISYYHLMRSEFSKALYYAYDSYKKNEEVFAYYFRSDCESIFLICQVLKSLNLRDECARWLKKIYKIKCKHINTKFHIKLWIFKAFINAEDIEKALGILDKAEKSATVIYGKKSDIHAEIEITKTFIFSINSQQKAATDAYRNYVSITHCNYGSNILGDQALLMSYYAEDKIQNSNYAEYEIILKEWTRMMDPFSVDFAPGVILNGYLFWADFYHNYDDKLNLSECYCDSAIRLINEKLMPSGLKELLAIKNVCGAISDSWFYSQSLFFLFTIKIHNAIKVKNYEKAMDIMTKAFDMIHGYKDYDLKIRSYLGLIFLEHGHTQSAIYHCMHIMENISDEHYIYMATIFASWFNSHEIWDEASYYYSRALEHHTIIRKSAADIAEININKAVNDNHFKPLEEVEEQLLEAERWIDSINNNAHLKVDLYHVWSNILHSHDENARAEEMLDKAIDLWESDDGLFDEKMTNFLVQKAILNINQNKLVNVKPLLDLAIQLHPLPKSHYAFNIYYYLAYYYFVSGNHNKGIKTVEKVKRNVILPEQRECIEELMESYGYHST